MRKLKLQMQITVDGFMAGPEGQLDWMTFEMDPQLLAFITELTDTSSTILLGRKMAPGFIQYWESIGSDSPEYSFARKMVETEKVAFSRTLHRMDGKNLRVQNGEAAEGVEAIKRQPGKDIVVYGGATFVSSLIESDLIDELNLFVNPVAIGSGLRVFHDRVPLGLIGSKAYASGVVVSTYRRLSPPKLTSVAA
jgi:dihydrofolate reductase